MEHYKVLLMERLKFEWSPRAGHGPGKWNNQYEKLKEFKVKNGHVDVPFEHGKNKLGKWSSCGTKIGISSYCWSPHTHTFVFRFLSRGSIVD
jgi:hypothetical protein